MFVFGCTRVSVLTNKLKHHSTSPFQHQLGVVSSILLFPVFNFINMETSDCHFVQLSFTCGEKTDWSNGDVASFKGGGKSPHSRKEEPNPQILLKPLWPVASSAMSFHLVEVSHRVPLLPNSLACKIAVS